MTGRICDWGEGQSLAADIPGKEQFRDYFLNNTLWTMFFSCDEGSICDVDVKSNGGPSRPPPLPLDLLDINIRYHLNTCMSLPETL
jgi:hypothetical protein